MRLPQVGGATVGPEPPVNPLVGSFWYDPTTDTLWVWVDDGTTQQWVAISGGGPPGPVIIPVSTTPLTDPVEGSVYFDPSTSTLYVYDGTQWLDPASGAGFPEAPPDGQWYFRDGLTESWVPFTIVNGGTY